MNKTENEQQQFNELIGIFYKNYFANNDIYSAIYDSFKDNMIKLTRAYTGFLCTHNILRAYIDTDQNFKKLKPSEQKQIKDICNGINTICNNIDEILTPIVDGMRE